MIISSGGGGAGAGGVVGPAAGIPLAAATRGRAINRKTATQFVNEFENPFGQKLAEIEILARTDPAAANAALAQAWEQYLNDGMAYANPTYNGTQLTNVANRDLALSQSLSNPKLLQTVNTLWQQTGGQGNLTDAYTARKEPGGGYWKPLGDIAAAIAAAAATRGGAGSLPLPKPPTELQTKPGGTGAQPPDPPTDPNSPEGKSFLSKLAPYLPFILGGVTDLYGAIAGGNAAEKAAEIEAASAKEATALQREMYETSRKDSMPWLQSGQASLAAMSNLMGLPQAESNPYAATAPYQNPVAHTRLTAARPMGRPLAAAVRR